MQIPKNELWIYEGVFIMILFTLLFSMATARTRMSVMNSEPFHPKKSISHIENAHVSVSSTHPDVYTSHSR